MNQAQINNLALGNWDGLELDTFNQKIVLLTIQVMKKMNKLCCFEEADTFYDQVWFEDKNAMFVLVVGMWNTQY